MLSTEIKKDIRRIRALERKAQNLSRQLYEVEREWGELMDDVSHTSEWEEDCNKRGVMSNPCWGDILA